jgi:hypothetical protein
VAVVVVVVVLVVVVVVVGSGSCCTNSFSWVTVITAWFVKVADGGFGFQIWRRAERIYSISFPESRKVVVHKRDSWNRTKSNPKLKPLKILRLGKQAQFLAISSDDDAYKIRILEMRFVYKESSRDRAKQKINIVVFV